VKRALATVAIAALPVLATVPGASAKDVAAATRGGETCTARATF
jgi:hypothetical protein